MEQQIMERFPGIGCAWADAAGKEAAEYNGFADRENRVPVDENTIFPACSISKFITAVCVMKLHEQKQIDIDRPVNRYLRQWKLLTPDGSESDASIRSVLCHTAGILDGEDAFYGLRRGDPEISLLDILEGRTSYNSRPARAEKPQGSAFEYSDAGYCVLQQMLQEMMQKSFNDIIRDRSLLPAVVSEPLLYPVGEYPDNDKDNEHRKELIYRIERIVCCDLSREHGKSQMRIKRCRKLSRYTFSGKSEDEPCNDRTDTSAYDCQQKSHRNYLIQLFEEIPSCKE